MTKWEYISVPIKQNDKGKEIDTFLTDLGVTGWELVSVVALDPTQTNEPWLRAFFKRKSE